MYTGRKPSQGGASVPIHIISNRTRNKHSLFAHTVSCRESGFELRQCRATFRTSCVTQLLETIRTTPSRAIKCRIVAGFEVHLLGATLGAAFLFPGATLRGSLLFLRSILWPFSAALLFLGATQLFSGAVLFFLFTPLAAESQVPFIVGPSICLALCFGSALPLTMWAFPNRFADPHSVQFRSIFFSHPLRIIDD